MDELLKNKSTLSEEKLKVIILPILDGLEQVHAAGFIHRDIKPANIFIRDDGSPVLLDFGSARQSFG
ncbi:MAG: AarF/UbiB family protein [Proteobacteria bacterium]|nr:AarF/UbiB family protein [Pseudomonadota bacterium]